MGRAAGGCAIGRGAVVGRAARAATAALGCCALILGCATARAGPDQRSPMPRVPPVRFAVIADPHLFDVSTSAPGPAFDSGLRGSARLHAESRAILERALADIAAERPEFLLVCGDLTANGERSGHELAAAMLRGFESSGVPVLVVPGNHDIANPWAARFDGESVERVPGVSPEEFAALHADFGYADALERDAGSLSYVAEPVPGLRVLALDACWYRGGPESPRIDGSLSRDTRAWVARALARAREHGDAAIVMIHHAVAPHFERMEARLDVCLLEGHRTVARLLAGGGARLVFTGHGHAQDIVRYTTADGPIWDVETGSLISWPNPWRLVEVGADGVVSIRSRRVTALDPSDTGFEALARSRLDAEMRHTALAMLQRRGVRGEAALAIARRAVEAGAAFFAGDEPGLATPVDRSALGPWARIAESAVRPLLDALATDLPPADNDVAFPLD